MMDVSLPDLSLESNLRKGSVYIVSAPNFSCLLYLPEYVLMNLPPTLP